MDSSARTSSRARGSRCIRACDLMLGKASSRPVVTTRRRSTAPAPRRCQPRARLRAGMRLDRQRPAVRTSRRGPPSWETAWMGGGSPASAVNAPSLLRNQSAAGGRRPVECWRGANGGRYRARPSASSRANNRHPCPRITRHRSPHLLTTSWTTSRWDRLPAPSRASTLRTRAALGPCELSAHDCLAVRLVDEDELLGVQRSESCARRLDHIYRVLR